MEVRRRKNKTLDNKETIQQNSGVNDDAKNTVNCDQDEEVYITFIHVTLSI